MLLTDIGKESLNSRETSGISMSSSYHYMKIANSVREGGFQKCSYSTGEFFITSMLFLCIYLIYLQLYFIMVYNHKWKKMILFKSHDKG